jgi:hypothetical protein
MPIEDEKLYEEIGRAWLYFDSWREKIFAGYLTVLAALALAFSKDASLYVRTAVFAFSIVVSVVFWILDFRTTELLNLCQAAGEQMAESKGFYGELNQRRFARKNRVSFGFAVSLLVSSVIATGAVGFLFCMVTWWRSADGISMWWLHIAVALCFGVLIFLYDYADKRWSEERNNYRKRFSKTAPGRSDQP